MADTADLSRWGVDERCLSERFVRASGPGGQNVNKVATAVELRLDVDSAPLSDEMKARLIALAGSKVVAGNVLLIDSRVYRTQGQNRDAARVRLAKLLTKAEQRPKNRRATRPSKASKERRIETKKQRSTVKARRTRTKDDD